MILGFLGIYKEYVLCALSLMSLIYLQHLCFFVYLHKLDQAHHILVYQVLWALYLGPVH